jgi:hypothetical protein
MVIAGHVSRQMLEHHSHLRLELKRKTLEALRTRSASSQGKTDSCDTNYDTRHTSGDIKEDVSCRNEWSWREDLSLRPPGPEDWAILSLVCMPLLLLYLEPPVRVHVFLETKLNKGTLGTKLGTAADLRSALGGPRHA